MFTVNDLEIDNNVENIYDYCIDKLLSDGMTILQNNSKVLKYLTDSTLKQEIEITAKSLSMAIRHARFELVQNILLGMKNNVHKLAALEIKYFDEFETLLRSDIYRTFMPKNFSRHAFVAPDLKEVLCILNETVKLSPTNAAFALKTLLECGHDVSLADKILNADFSKEFVVQTEKRFLANFGQTFEDIINENGHEKNKQIAFLEKIIKVAV